jgi:CubicO group peptidase (beta-lactamase class C family)
MKKFQPGEITSTNVLPRGIPEANGISSSSITRFLEVAHIKFELHSFMLVRHGQVVAEAWWSPYSSEHRHQLFSLSKSFTSTAGFAVSEGLLDVEDLVVSYFPDKHINDQTYWKEMRIKHLLTMSTGHAKDPMEAVVRQEEWVQAILNEPPNDPPGTSFLYNSSASYLLSAIIQQVTGETLHNYLQPRLYEPLDIRDAAWSTCPRGISRGGVGLSIKTEDIAKFGQLYLQRGTGRVSRSFLRLGWTMPLHSRYLRQIAEEQPIGLWAMGISFGVLDMTPIGVQVHTDNIV